MEVRTRVAVVLDQIEPAAAQLAATLQPAQLDTLARKFAKGNAEWRSDFVDVPLQKARARRFKQARERFEMLYGTLNEAQSDALKRAIAQSVFDPALAYAERLRRQQDTLQTLKTIMSTAGASADSSATAGAAIRALMARTLVPSDGAYRRYQDALTTEGCVVFAELHQRATAAQRSHAAQTLQRYELLLLSLAGAS